MEQPARGEGPGKTAPKLVQDFLAFDPKKGNPNILLDFPPPQGEGQQLAPHFASCKHDYTPKSAQSVPPPLDLRPDGNTVYKVAVLCKRCRIHADVHIDYTQASQPCPANENPLHHFQQMTSLHVKQQGRISYAWQCSVHACQALLLFSYRVPRITDADISLLTTPDKLKRRYEALLEVDPDRQEVKEATPLQPLARLQRYVQDSVSGKRDKLPAHNKRFQEACGVQGMDCRELLERLGFKYAQGEEENFWLMPHPDEVPNRLQAYGSTHREFLEDVDCELSAIMAKMAAETGMINPNAQNPMASADMDIQRTLAATSYQRTISRRYSNTELPYYNSLGILPDFSDSLVEYAYDRQVQCDPVSTPYYLECLQAINDSRGTEQLQVKVATLQSQSVVSRRDLSAAYRSFNISIAESRTISDEAIRDRFQARNADIGTIAQQESRQHLYNIAQSRNSTLLLNASRQSVDTYEDALSWLGNGVNKDTNDDGIIAVFGFKRSESKEAEEIGLKALGTIAKARKSNMLNNFLLTGEQESPPMGVDEALRHLGIESKLEDVDQTVLPVLFESARQDRPGDITEKAITAIQQALASSESGTSTPDNWPVGLTSHGNTCYLNSLLQYYFSIRPLRDIVLNYDEYKWNTAIQGAKEVRVGHVFPTNVEIEGGQRFAEELKRLFQRMIKSRDSAVKPDADLVCRAFLKPKDYQLLDPNMDDKKVNGAVEHAIDDKVGDDDVIASPTASSATLADGKESDASSTTLVNGENGDLAMKDVAQLTPPPSPGMDGIEQPKQDPAPPPLPARRFSTTKEQALEQAQAKARAQQDVTEVHDSITSLLRNGMSPLGKDAEDEQEDVLRALFSIQTAQTIIKDGAESKPGIQFDSAITLNVPYVDTDIYSALDAVFDLQPHDEGIASEAYRTMKSLGPLLQISIPRIGFDSTRLTSLFKTTSCVKLEDELYLDRYFNTSHPDTPRRRRQAWAWRKQLHKLERELKALKDAPVGLDGPNAIAQAAEYLSSLDNLNTELVSVGIEPIDADGEITDVLMNEAKAQAQQVASLESEIRGLQTQLDNQWKDMKNIKYRLAAVFFHRGASGHGHYWVYIHDFANDMWRWYNDERVEKFTKYEHIFQAKGYDQGTPTYAVYVAADKLEAMVQPVCRDPEPAPEIPAIADAEMTGGDEEPQLDGFKPGIKGDPVLTTEGGTNDWDNERQVPEVPCVDLQRMLLAHDASFQRRRRQMTFAGEFPESTSAPKRARDVSGGSVAAGASPPKLAKSATMLEKLRSLESCSDRRGSLPAIDDLRIER